MMHLNRSKKIYTEH